MRARRLHREQALAAREAHLKEVTVARDEQRSQKVRNAMARALTVLMKTVEANPTTMAQLRGLWNVFHKDPGESQSGSVMRADIDSLLTLAVFIQDTPRHHILRLATKVLKARVPLVGVTRTTLILILARK